MKDTFITATIGSPFGLDGFVKIKSMSGEVNHLIELKETTVLKDGKERILKIEELRESPLSIRFSGFDTPEKAKTLLGSEIIASREQAAPLNKDEYYIEDLKDLRVVTKEGKEIGIITDIIEGGGGELIEINVKGEGRREKKENRSMKQQGSLSNNKPQPPAPSPQSLRLVPFRKEFFPEINPEKGIVVIDNLWILD